MTTVGKVYLVGAGPGDPGLVTLRAKQLLEKADVVLYDALIDPQILAWAKSDCEKISVGKRGGEESISQEEIQALIWEYAVPGKIVVRLKGGDPMIFGRGGEEAEFLASHAIPFEIVPGITSAIAAPTYAGIPLTHRDYSSSVAFVTGHRKDSSLPPQIPSYGSVETVVVLMGFKNLADVISELMNKKWPGDTPVAIIEKGTTPQQKVIEGKIQNIVAAARVEKLEGPALLVVGQVVRLREFINWFEKRPLFGLTVLVTRGKQQAEELRNLLEDEGARVTLLPTIEVVPLADRAELADLDHAVAKIEEYDWVVFTSQNAVRFFFERVKITCGSLPNLENVQLAAIGPATAEAIREAGFSVHRVPDQTFQQEGLLEILSSENLDGKKILFPRSLQARDFMVKALRQRGALVDDIPVYTVRCPEVDRERLQVELARQKINIVTFTSSSTVHHFFELLGEAAKSFLESRKIAAIGNITAQTLAEYRHTAHIVAPQSTIPGLVQAIVDDVVQRRMDPSHV